MPEISETTEIPGNRSLSPADKLARIREIYRPFHGTITDLLDRRAADGVRSMVMTIHSFTPVYKGERRAVELGILHDQDATAVEEAHHQLPRGGCPPQRAVRDRPTACSTRSTARGAAGSCRA